MIVWDWHNKVSVCKSVIRVIGFILLPVSLLNSAVLLVLAEILGLVEEF